MFSFVVDALSLLLLSFQDAAFFFRQLIESLSRGIDLISKLVKVLFHSNLESWLHVICNINLTRLEHGELLLLLGDLFLELSFSLIVFLSHQCDHVIDSGISTIFHLLELLFHFIL